MSKKPGIIEINGQWVDVCFYKNCRLPMEEGYVICKKHIGQWKRDEGSAGMRKMRRNQAITRILRNPRKAVVI